jgi:hypothetical protein
MSQAKLIAEAEKFFEDIGDDEDLDPTTRLVWSYSIGPFDVDRAGPLAEVFQAHGLTIGERVPGETAPDRWELRVSETRRHTADSFAERVVELDALARAQGVELLDWGVDAAPESEEPEPEGPPTAGRCITRQEIAELACKVIAVWILVEGVLGIAPLFVFLFTVFLITDPRQTFTMSSYAAIPALGQLLVGAFCWKLSRRIARRMVRRNPTPVVRTDLDPDTLLAIALTVLGMYILWTACHGICVTIAQELYFVRMANSLYASPYSAMPHHDGQWYGGIAARVFSIAFGIWLVFGSRGITRIIKHIRGEERLWGHDAAPPSDAQEP